MNSSVEQEMAEGFTTEEPPRNHFQLVDNVIAHSLMRTRINVVFLFQWDDAGPDINEQFPIQVPISESRAHSN